MFDAPKAPMPDRVTRREAPPQAVRRPSVVARPVMGRPNVLSQADDTERESTTAAWIILGLAGIGMVVLLSR